MTKRWMIYGATGFSGRLIASRAKELGLKPVLAGRRREAVESLARELGLESRVFSLDESAKLEASLEGMSTVLHCAGPFSATAAAMLDACLSQRVNYLDITGEIPVFEMTYARDRAARDAGVALVSGVGCDVVPSDCLANHLAHELEKPESLELACAFATTPSSGTLRTLIEQFPKGGAVVRGGKRIAVRHAEYVRNVDFPSGPRFVVSAPWADLVSASRCTKIPDVTVYFPMPKPIAFFARVFSPFAKIFAWNPLQRVLRWASGSVASKDGKPQSDGWLCWWGQVTAGDQRASARIEIPDPYTFTVHSTIAAVQRTLEGDVAPGAHTPSQAFGKSFALSLPDVRFTWQERAQQKRVGESSSLNA